MECQLKLKSLLFDEITFKRLGDQNKNELEISVEINIGTNINDDDVKKISVKICGNKENEYTFLVQASGVFVYKGNSDDSMIQQNAVAIMMPYLRSEISLITAQPGTKTVVLPPFNIVEMMGEKQ